MLLTSLCSQEQRYKFECGCYLLCDVEMLLASLSSQEQIRVLLLVLLCDAVGVVLRRQFIVFSLNQFFK